MYTCTYKWLSTYRIKLQLYGASIMEILECFNVRFFKNSFTVITLITVYQLEYYIMSSEVVNGPLTISSMAFVAI